VGNVYRRVHFKRGRRIQGHVYWVQYYRGGRKIRESSGSTKEAEARRLLKLREGAVAQGVPVTQRTGTVQMGELFEDVVTDWKINGRRSLRDLKRRIDSHLTPFFYGKRAAQISTADVRRFTLLRLEAGASNAEINRELAIVRRAFKLAEQNGKVLNRPYVQMLRENNVRSGFFERAQFEAVRRHLTEDLAAAVTFAYVTGWRTYSEILKLKWRNVDLDNGRVMLDAGTTKNDAARTFPFTEELRGLMERQRERTDALQRENRTVIPWVFHRAGTPIRVFRRAWVTACRKAGVPGRIPHDFRRTAVRNLVRAGIPERVAMTMTGHKTRSVFERYNIVSEGDLTEAARKLDAAARQSPATATTAAAG
jgi:integrase